MSIHTDRIVLVFPIAQKNRQAAASLQTLEITDSGRELENLVPLDPALVNEYADEFNLGNLSKITELEADKTKLTTDLAAKTTAYDSEVAKVTALEAEKATLINEKAALTADLATANATIATLTSEKTALTSQVESLTTQLAAKTDELAESRTELQSQISSLEAERIVLNTTIATLQTEVTKLTAIRAYNPRWTTPDFFQNRFTVKTARMFERSDDPVIAGGRDLLDEYELQGYHVDLDDPQVQGLTAYMVQLGMLTEQERSHVLRDATAAEAWYPE